MHAMIETKRPEIERLCRELGVRRLDVFGSATGDSFDEISSDFDVLVEFDAVLGFDCFGSYFGLKEGLEAIIGRPVDMVTASSVQNPYFRERVVRTREYEEFLADLYASRRAELPLAAFNIRDFADFAEHEGLERTRN
jgi:predicted nucleotidyltransferase